MGGVDILDKLLSSYRPRLRSKKWWWNLFSNALNLAVVAAWRLHRELHQKRVEFHCPVTSGFQKRYHNTFSPSKTSANHSDWTKSISTRNFEKK
ncbi:hypothetical protein T03_13122 [Trichinella britovi]|uniref:PiggyBac transposable element-derived protein 3 n=1 Tax=Trichinella britovi TaxID=45882 RepID=A0A0V1AHK0_TRIBR|nr:hypothetical protein T03_9897 [Trichinella britovi]KRY24443.1 hypothetical protein T03_13122 [Trichinella britovi]